MPKIRTLFCLVDSKKRSFLTSCVFWFVFFNTSSHLCFWLVEQSFRKLFIRAKSYILYLYALLKQTAPFMWLVQRLLWAGTKYQEGGRRQVKERDEEYCVRKDRRQRDIRLPSLLLLLFPMLWISLRLSPCMVIRTELQSVYLPKEIDHCPLSATVHRWRMTPEMRCRVYSSSSYHK